MASTRRSTVSGSDGLRDGLFGGGLLRVEGQEDGEDGPAFAGSGGAAHANGTAMVLDDALAHPQAEPGAYVFFGGEEGLKELRADGSGNAAAGIGHGKADAVGFVA